MLCSMFVWWMDHDAVARFWQGWPMRASYEDVGLLETAALRYSASVGGMKPPAWKNPRRLLSYEERCQIQALLATGLSIRKVAAQLGRAPSTISREIRNNTYAKTRHQFRAARAHRSAWNARRRPKPSKFAADQRLRQWVQQRLDENYSPGQIVGRLQCELKARLRTGRSVRKPRRTGGGKRGQNKNMINISQRPEDAGLRSVPGHWEGDLIIGKNGASCIGTVVERYSNYLLLFWMEPAKSRIDAFCEGLVEKLGALPENLKQSLTWDQGKEMAEHPHTRRT